MDRRNAGVVIKKVKLKVGGILRFKDDWEEMVPFLQRHKLIPDEKVCPHCSFDLIIQRGNKNKDGALWRYVIDFFDTFIWFFFKK